MTMTEMIQERAPLVATIDPQTITSTATAASDAVDMATFRRVRFTLLTGTLDGTSAVGIALQVSDATGSGWATTGVAGYTIAGVAASAQGDVEIDASAMPDGKRYVRALLTAAATNTGGPVAVAGYGFDARYGSADGEALDSVTGYPSVP